MAKTCSTCACDKVSNHYIHGYEDCGNYISVDAVEVVHGQWKFHKDGSGTCNRCGFTQKNVWDYDNWQNYCGHCGAKMDGKVKE